MDIANDENVHLAMRCYERSLNKLKSIAFVFVIYIRPFA